jgi:hypothetical protein
VNDLAIASAWQVNVARERVRDLEMAFTSVAVGPARIMI